MSDEAPGLEWVEGAPRSRRFGDVYFSAVDGLAESRAVFLAGCGLPDAWAGCRRFVVGELGFGTGLNMLALLDLWRAARPSEGRLHLFSVEAFPLSRDEAALALAAWPELADTAAALLAAWPPARPGFHRIDFPGLDAVLDLWIGEAADGLAAWAGAADAWFLDGFAPARNPQMWTQGVLNLVAARSAAGARAATFTVAGAVRRGLAEAGFTVSKRPGFGRKRERLEAVIAGEPPVEPAPPRVAIVGAGIAGASLARAFAALGVQATVLEAAQPGAGASGNAAALVSPRLDAGGGAVADLHAQAWDRAVRLYRDVPGAVLAGGALQLEVGPRDAARFDRIAAWQGFAPDAVNRVSAEAAAAATGEPPAVGGLSLPEAVTVTPAAILGAWLPKAVPGSVAALEPAPAGWRLLDHEGTPIVEADVVCLAAGPHSAALWGLGPLRPVRGQVSTVADASPPGGASAWGGYVIPTAEGLLFGATHDRDDWDTAVRPQDHARNLAQLGQARPNLAATLAGAPLGGRASLRAATPDHMPLAGALAPGLFALSGLGGRGFTLAPLLAEQVAAQALGAPRPLPTGLAKLVDPTRYAPAQGVRPAEAET